MPMKENEQAKDFQYLNDEINILIDVRYEQKKKLLTDQNLIISSSMVIQMQFMQLNCGRVLLLLSLMMIVNSFQFKTPDVSADPLTIGTSSAYTITLLRQLTSQATSTAYNTQAVPSDSLITVKFPSQIALSGSQTCNLLIIDSSFIQTYTCSIDTSNNTIIISEAITSDSFIASVTVGISGVTNPSIALSTSAFTGTIGNDVSASEVGTQTSSSISYTAGSLQSALVEFDPNTVNTTSSMIVTIKNSHQIHSEGEITVTFSNGLTWRNDLNPSHQLPITSQIDCSAINNIHFTVTCTGNANTATVTLQNVFSSNISIGTQIKFAINSLFSPPTTEPNLYEVILTTYDTSTGTAYKIDESSTFVSGLQEKRSTMNISSSNQILVNSEIPLTFDFSLLDSISNEDYIIIQFPTGSVVDFITRISLELNLNGQSYNSSTDQLRFDLASSNGIKNADYSVSITFFKYRVPASVKETDPITLSFYNNGYLKMSFTDTITPLPKSYSATVTTANTRINSETSYSITFPLTDSLLNTGYIEINLPSQLTFASSISATIQGSSFSVTPTITNTSSQLTLSSLSTNESIAAQNLTINIEGIIQPASTVPISPFTGSVYYSDQNDLVGTLSTTSEITIRAGQISALSVLPSSLVTAQSGVTYEFTFILADSVENNSQFILSAPSDISIEVGGNCFINNISVSCSILNNTITFTASAFSANQTITLSYSAITNPSSTAPTSTFDLSVQSQANFLINILSENPFIQMSTPNTLNSVSLIRSSNENSKETFYTFSLTQAQEILSDTAQVIFTFPEEISINQNNLACTNTSISASLNCSKQNNSNSISVQIATQQKQNAEYSIRFGGIVNPYSFAPTSSSIFIETKTTNLQYSYSKINEGLTVTNTIPSAFTNLTFQFSNRVLSSQTNLTLSLEVPNPITSLKLLFASSFAVNSSSSIVCQSSQFTPICTLEENTTNSLFQLKVQSDSPIQNPFTLTISTLNTPNNISTDYSSLTSYDDQGHIISQSNNLIQFTTLCTFPCKNCQNNTPAVCEACYDTSISSQVYLHEGTCVASCPSGYYENEGDSICGQCQVPCLQCQNSSNFCTFCDLNSTFIYLNATDTTSTCLSQCPIFLYADTTTIPNVCRECVQPCEKCNSSQDCESCIDGYFYYNRRCLSACPGQVTVTSGSNCLDCSSECATCSSSVSNCVTCSSEAALYNGTCVLECPANLIIFNSECKQCNSECLTCENDPSNCTSCSILSSLPYFYENQCLDVCPNFYYPDTFKQCFPCANLSIGCQNCSSPTVCLSCDSGYVLLDSNCLTNVPEGYLNISGRAIACEGDCETCSVTLTNCTSCKNLSLFGTTCMNQCPAGTISINQVCVDCQYPCDTCESAIDKCTSCASNSSLFLLANNCVQEEICPNETYPNSVDLICSPCQSPCLNCISASSCQSCVSGFYLMSNISSCQTQCPLGMVGVNRVCQDCESPCEDCTVDVGRCTSCIESYFYNSNTNQCLTQCPEGLISNFSLMECIGCQTPCKTCQNTTDTCLSCVIDTFLSESSCVSVCPLGQYGVSGLCKTCVNNCSTCSSATQCVSCDVPLFLFSQQCIEECPSTHAIYNNQSQCISCQTVMNGCSNCSENKECYECYSPFIYFNGECLSQCPSGYELIDFSCQVKNETIVNEELEQILTNQEVFPFPFTIFAGIIVFSVLMSKLQNRNTYIIGALYALIGLEQTLSISYLLYRYYSIGSDQYEIIYIYLLLGTLGLIYTLNLLGLIVQTIVLNLDSFFGQWMRVSCHKCFYSFSIIFSFALNYKFKMIIFSKLFKFSVFSAQLSNVSKFRIFNIYSFFGLIAEGVALFVCFTLVFKFVNTLVLYYAFLDTIIICIINIILALLINWKEEDFFHEQEGQYTLNKKIEVGADDYSKEALEADFEQNHYRKTFLEAENTYSVSNVKAIQEEQLQSSDYYEEVQAVKKQVKPRIYFTNQESSCQIRKSQVEKQKIEEEDVVNSPNIFNKIDLEDQSQEIKSLAHHSLFFADDDFVENFEVSEGGGSEKQIQPKIKIQKKVYVESQKVKTNLATQNQKEGIQQKISQRQIELDEVKREMEEKQKLRRQNRKNHKKNKKSIESIEVPIRSPKKSTIQEDDQNQNPKEPSFESLTIKDSSQKDPTEEETGTLEQNKPQNVFLDEEKKLDEIGEELYEPKETIGSWIQMKVNEKNKDMPIFTYHKFKSLQHEQESNEGDKKDEDANKKNENKMKNEKEDKQQLVFQKQLESISHEIEEYKNKGKQINKINHQKQQQEQIREVKNYQSEDNQDISDNNTLKMSSIKKKNQLFEFQDQIDHQFNERTNTRMNLYQNNDEVGLEESEHQDEKINQRPYSATHQNQSNNQALLDILQKAEKDHENLQKYLHHHNRLPQDTQRYSFEREERLGGFKYTGPSLKEEQIKSQIYKAGVQQIEQDGLRRKHSENHPLSNKKKIMMPDDSDLESSINEMGRSRNKSINSVTMYKKFTSKNLSSDQLDELDFNNISLKNDYSHLLNQRKTKNQFDQRRGNISRDMEPPKHQSISKIRKQNFTRQPHHNEDESLPRKDDDLKLYYHKDSKNKGSNLEGGGSKGKNKKSVERQLSNEDSKRLKHLQRIYLPSPKK